MRCIGSNTKSIGAFMKSNTMGTNTLHIETIALHKETMTKCKETLIIEPRHEKTFRGFRPGLKPASSPIEAN